MTNHTHAPWDSRNCGAHGAVVSGPFGITVAWCGTNITSTTDGGHFITPDEAAANARLIAAAPELLAALKALAHRVNTHADKAHLQLLVSELCLAQAVIKKAGGEV